LLIFSTYFLFMKTFYHYFLLFFVFIAGNFFISETFANYDYVCSQYTTACNGTWETSWRSDGTKHYIGTKIRTTRIGNTRVGCPGSAYGSETYRNNGGYMYGDVNTTMSCEYVLYDNIAPSIHINVDPIDTQTTYNTPVGCTGTGCTGTAVDHQHLTDSHTVNCDDGSDIMDWTSGKFGNSGCRTASSVYTVSAGFVGTYTVYDKAWNSTTCNSNNTNCTSSVVATVIPIITDNCWFGGCNYPNDHVAPIGQMSYSPAICTKQDVTVTNTCISDFWDNGWPGSGCRPAPQDKAVLSIANNQVGTLWIADKAGNVADLPWSVDWIDKTPPYALQFVTNNQVAGPNNIFVISAKDAVIWPGCANPNLNYRIDITGAETKTITGTTPRDGTLTSGKLNLTKSGNYNLHITIIDQAGNTTSTDYSGTLVIYPAAPNALHSSLALISNDRDARYANNTSMYTYKLTLKDVYDNPIYGKSITGLNQEWGAKTIKIDMTSPGSPTWTDALTEQWSGVTNSNGEINFTIKSFTPGVFSEIFKISMSTWDDNYQDTGTIQNVSISSWNENSFRKPFTWALSITTSPYNLSIGTMLTMRLGVTQKSTLSTYSIAQFKDQMQLVDSTNHEFQNMGDAINLNSNPTIDYRINAKTDAWVSIVPGVFISGNPIISYTLDGQTVRYRLSATDSATDTVNLALWWTQLNSLKVVGSLQWQGKQTLASQSANFSDISKSDMRTIIRKNAYTLIRWRTSGPIIGGVKYIEGSATLSGEPSYETLIVKNGNLTISDTFNTTNKKFGIIVIRDSATQITKGNIYVQPTVRYIRAAIYADGGIISNGFSNDTVDTYKDSVERTNVLSEQLVIKGTLFTRNTIGGAIKGSTGKYILPGWSSTNDFDQAMMYDLNYMRRNNHGYNISGIDGSKDYNQGNQNNVVIIFDSNLQSSPPKGFK